MAFFPRFFAGGWGDSGGGVVTGVPRRLGSVCLKGCTDVLKRAELCREEFEGQAVSEGREPNLNAPLRRPRPN